MHIVCVCVCVLKLTQTVIMTETYILINIINWEYFIQAGKLFNTEWGQASQNSSPDSPGIETIQPARQCNKEKI